MNGFIVWYQRPIDGLSGLTGLFNNPNYMGSWLKYIIWPVCLACLIESNKRIIRSLVNSYILFWNFSIDIINKFKICMDKYFYRHAFIFWKKKL